MSLCASEEARSALLADSAALMPSLDGLSPPRPPPPPMLLVAGPRGCGKEEQVRRLADARRLPLLELRALMDANPPPPPAEGEEPPEEAEAEDDEGNAARLVHTPAMIAALLATAGGVPPFLGVGVVVEWAYDVPLDAEMATALQEAAVTPDAVVLLELGDEDAVSRLLEPSPSPNSALISNPNPTPLHPNLTQVSRLLTPIKVPTHKDAEDKVRLDKAVALLTEQMEAEDEGGLLKELFAAEDLLAIERAASSMLGSVGAIERSEVREMLDSMLEAAEASDSAQKEELAAANAASKDAFDSGVEAFTAASVPVIKLNALAKSGQLHWQIREELAPWLTRRPALFAKACALEPIDAATQLEDGSALLSKFGYHDPHLLITSKLLSSPLVPTKSTVNPPPPPTAEEIVEAAEDGEEVPMVVAPSEPEAEGVFCARLHERIYVFATRSARQAFLTDPIRYALAAPPPPHVPPRAAVLGCGSAASTLATKLAAKLKAVHVSVQEAVLWAKERGTAIGLASAVVASTGGTTLSDEQAVRLLEQRLYAPDVLRRGWVLEGGPLTAALAAALDARGLRPHRAYSAPPPNEPPCEAAAEGSDLAMRGLVVPIDTSRNSWHQLHTALSDMQATLSQRQRYVSAIAEGRAAAVSDLGIHPDDFEAHLGRFRTVCPVTWACERRLWRHGQGASGTARRGPLQSAAEYKGKYYTFKGPSQLTCFLMRPSEILASPALPSDVARAVRVEEATLRKGDVELDGYCSVTLGRGPKGSDYLARVASLKLGSSEHTAEYGGKLYLMNDAAKQAEFLSRPWRYTVVKLPAKLPPSAIELIIANLPIRGLIEQSMGELLTRALTELTTMRPVYPTLDRRETALKFVSLYLRAHNPKRRPPHLKAKYDASLLEYADCCTAADKLIKFQDAGGSQTEGFDILNLPEELARANEMWDTIQKRDVRDFF